MTNAPSSTMLLRLQNSVLEAGRRSKVATSPSARRQLAAPTKPAPKPAAHSAPRPKWRISPIIAQTLFAIAISFFVLANLALLWCWLHMDLVRQWALSIRGA